ncbi:MAG: hypothetical protein ACW975_03415 [Candidatus Thorarchaeota archaeon]
MSENHKTPPAIGRLEEILSVIEEIDARLRKLQEALSFVAAEAERIDGSSIRDHFEGIEEIGHVIDAVEVEVDVLETRISTIESLRKHQK